LLRITIVETFNAPFEDLNTYTCTKWTIVPLAGFFQHV
jgi:hypothetical protein